MMNVLAIDPGPVKSAYVLWDGTQLLDHADVPNEEYYEWRLHHWASVEFADCYIEKVVGMGQIAGAELFDTAFVAGRLFQCWARHRPFPATMVSRKDAKRHFAAKNDAEVARYLQQRFGKRAVNGLNNHEYAALALAVYAFDVRRTKI